MFTVGHFQSPSNNAEHLHNWPAQIKTLAAFNLAGIYTKKRIIDEITHFHHGIARVFALNEPRLEIIEVDAGERLLDMELPRFAISPRPVPVKHAVSRV